jgi:hypothetical protein
MFIIDNNISKITTGYKKIHAAENELHNKWRVPLLTKYANQRSQFESELNQYNERQQVFNQRIRWGILMASLLLALGLLVLPGLIMIVELGEIRGPLFCFAPLLILGGLTGWAIIIVLWIWHRDDQKPNPPKNPLKSGVIYPLYPLWKEGLRGELPRKKPHPGATGEYHFITRLLSLDEEFYILYGIQQRFGEDIDVTLVGSKGIWVFEVKYLKGLVRWKEGEWSQIQPNSRLNPRTKTKIINPSQDFHIQWKRAAGDVAETVRLRTPKLVSRLPKVTMVRGGIVFSHPQGRYDIPPGCPFNWGIIPFWMDKLRTVPPIPGMDEYAIMQVLDALLVRHRQIAGIERVHSMESYADKIVLAAEDYLGNWIAQQ